VVSVIIALICNEIGDARERAKARAYLAEQNVAPAPSYELPPIPVDRPDSPLYDTVPPPPAYTNNPIVKGAYAGVREYYIYYAHKMPDESQQSSGNSTEGQTQPSEMSTISPVRFLQLIVKYDISSDRFLVSAAVSISSTCSR
jgi:hypothetical protein